MQHYHASWQPALVLLTELLDGCQTNSGPHVEHLLHVELLHSNLRNNPPECILVGGISPNGHEVVTRDSLCTAKHIALQHVQQPWDPLLVKEPWSVP